MKTRFSIRTTEEESRVIAENVIRSGLSEREFIKSRLLENNKAEIKLLSFRVNTLRSLDHLIIKIRQNENLCVRDIVAVKKEVSQHE